MREHIVSVKQFYTRGSTWFSYLMQVGILTANAKLFEDFFKTLFGWSVGETVVIGVIGYIIIATIIGGFDLHYGIWKQENDWAWNSTPAAKKLSEDVDEIKNTIAHMDI